MPFDHYGQDNSRTQHIRCSVDCSPLESEWIRIHVSRSSLSCALVHQASQQKISNIKLVVTFKLCVMDSHSFPSSNRSRSNTGNIITRSTMYKRTRSSLFFAAIPLYTRGRGFTTISAVYCPATVLLVRNKCEHFASKCLYETRRHHEKQSWQ